MTTASPAKIGTTCRVSATASTATASTAITPQTPNRYRRSSDAISR